MKLVTCSSVSCPSRRRHHEGPYEGRGPQTFEVPDDVRPPWFCSIECSCYYQQELALGLSLLRPPGMEK